MPDMVWTWNVLIANFVIPLCLLILWGAIKRQFAERDKKDDRISALLAEKEVEKDRHLAEVDAIKQKDISMWRKNFSETQCAIKVALDRVEASLQDKVTWDHCNERRKVRDQETIRFEDRLRAGGI